ncbi:MAG TPA: hypothetical protein VIZ00_01005, partial [Streptosporangiaceae bacterium]
GTASLPWPAEASPSGQAPADPSYWNSPPAAPPPAAPALAASEPPPLPSVPSLPTIGVQSRLAAAGNEPVSPEADWAELVTGPQPAITDPAPFRSPSSPSPPFGAGSFGPDSFTPDSFTPDSLRAGSFGSDSFGSGGFPAAGFGGDSFGGTASLDPRPSAPPAPPEPDPANFGLPSRVRQASLAPQLRQPTRPDLASGRSSGLPSPEAARTTMAALQRGWELGRSAADGPSAPDAGVPPAADND